MVNNPVAKRGSADAAFFGVVNKKSAIWPGLVGLLPQFRPECKQLLRELKVKLGNGACPLFAF